MHLRLYFPPRVPCCTNSNSFCFFSFSYIHRFYLYRFYHATSEASKISQTSENALLVCFFLSTPIRLFGLMEVRIGYTMGEDFSFSRFCTHKRWSNIRKELSSLQQAERIYLKPNSSFQVATATSAQPFYKYNNGLSI